MEDHKKGVGKRIVALRTAMGVTQPELAELAKISQNALWKIEKGRTVEVTATTFIALCRSLNTTWEYLWEGAGPQSEDDRAAEEAELLAICRRLEPKARAAILMTAHTVLAAAQPTTPAAAEPTVADGAKIAAKQSRQQAAARQAAKTKTKNKSQPLR